MSKYIRKSVRSLRGYVPGEQPGDSGPPLVKLNTNENPYPPSPAVAETLRGFNANSLRLYPDPDSREVRSAIAGLHGCALEQVFAGNGSDEILALSTRAFVEDDGAVGFFDPSYSLYPVLAGIRNVKPIPCKLGPNFEWRTPENLSASLFFLANPNAPTGIRYPDEEVRAFCAGFKGVVVIDEAYAAFAEGNCMSLAIEMENVLAVRTLSKSHSLAGLRFGYGVGSTPLIEALFKIKDSYNLDRIAQSVALKAILDEAAASRNIDRVKRTRRRFAEKLAALGFKVCPSETNFLWVRPPGMTAGSFYRQLRKRNILVRYFAGPLTGRFLRITVGTDEQMDGLMDAAEEIIDQNPQAGKESHEEESR